MTTPQEPGDAGQPGEQKPIEPMPAAPALNEPELAPAAPVARPGSVTGAFVVWLVLGAILLISAILVMLVSTADLEDTVRKALEDAGRRPTDQEVKDAAVVARWGGILYNLVFAALLIGFAFPMRNGANWARITLCVVGGLLVVLSLFFGNLVVTLIGLVLLAVAAILMFRKDSNQFFLRGRVQR